MAHPPHRGFTMILTVNPAIRMSRPEGFFCPRDSEPRRIPNNSESGASNPFPVLLFLGLFENTKARPQKHEPCKPIPPRFSGWSVRSSLSYRNVTPYIYKFRECGLTGKASSHLATKQKTLKKDQGNSQATFKK